jgi:hypothetical protein
MATDHKRLFREGAAKVSGQIAQQMDSVYGAVANPEVIAVGMMRDLGANDLGAGPGVTRTVSNKLTEDSAELIAARKTGSLERVLRVKRQQASTREEKVTSPSEPRRPLKEIYDFSQFDDDEIGLLDPATLTSSSRDAYVEELDQRMAGGGSFAEAQAWQAGETEALGADDSNDDLGEDDYGSLFQQTPWEREQT